MLIAPFFLIASLALAYTAVLQGSVWYLLLWPALSLLLVSAAYFSRSPNVFAKRSSGKLGIPQTVLLFPFLAYTWITWYVLKTTGKEAVMSPITKSVFIGRRLLPFEFTSEIKSILDLTAEFPEVGASRKGRVYACVPILDGMAMSPQALLATAQRVASLPHPVLIHCAQGHGRSAMVGAAYLVLSGAAKTSEEAISLLQSARPKARLAACQRKALEDFEEIYHEQESTRGMESQSAQTGVDAAELEGDEIESDQTADTLDL